jgi:hypothetical protein
MATILLGIAGASLGGRLFGPGLGVVAGRAIGALAGSLIDRPLSVRWRRRSSAPGRGSPPPTSKTPPKARRSTGCTAARG